MLEENGLSDISRDFLALIS